MAPHFFRLVTRKRKRPLKKKKIQGNPDRFNNLPDSLLIHILSFLELKDLVQTSLLSKRWKLLWTQVDSIIIDCHLEEDFSIRRKLWRKQVRRYFSSVDKTLTQFSRIRNFSFTGFDSYHCRPEIVNKWIQYALDLNVETMNLDFKESSSYAPPSLFQSSSLTQLEMYDGFYDWGPPVNLPLLKSLSLSEIHLGDEELEKMLVGCPVLETLVLTDAMCPNVMRIVSLSLKNVKLINVTCQCRDADGFLEIRAPLLKHLEIYGYFMARKCVFWGLYSLVQARLIFNICPPHSFSDDYGSRDWILMVEGVLKSLSHVGDLVIGGDLLQALTILLSGEEPSLTFMCKDIRTVSPLRKYDLPGIMYLIGSAPYLEGLIVEVYYPEDISLIDQVKEADSVNFLHVLSNVKWDFYHLKTVVIEYQRNPCVDYLPHHIQAEEKCLDFELVDYILRSCVALERLALWSLKPCCNYTKCLKPDCAFQHVNQLSSKLVMHSLPRSRSTEWKFKKWEVNEQEFVFAYAFSKHTSMPFEG